MRNRLLLLSLVLLLAGGVWFFVSPSMAMNGLRDAAIDADREELEERIDFPEIRKSLKSQFRAKLAAQTVKEDSNPFAALGSILAIGMIDGMVESFVTPDALAEMIKAGRVSREGDDPTTSNSASTDWIIERSGINKFTASPSGSESNGPRLVFERDGISWMLVDIRLPDESPEEE